MDKMEIEENAELIDFNKEYKRGNAAPLRVINKNIARIIQNTTHCQFCTSYKGKSDLDDDCILCTSPDRAVADDMLLNTVRYSEEYMENGDCEVLCPSVFGFTCQYYEHLILGE